jgi:hypothetical protein
MSFASTIRDALNNTPADYLNSVISMRSPTSEDRAGSFFDTEVGTHEIMEAAERAEVYTPGEGQSLPICKYFRLPLPGTVGMVDLDTLPEGATLNLEDPKGTVGTEGGGVSCVYRGEGVDNLARADFSVLILGPSEEDESKLCVWTIHPGDTTPRPGDAVNDPKHVGRTVTVDEAKALGFVLAKVA